MPRSTLGTGLDAKECKMRKAVAGVGLTLMAMALTGGAANAEVSTQPRITMQRDCSSYPADHIVRISLSGFPPGAPFTGTLKIDPGFTLGPVSFLIQADGGYDFGGFASQQPATFTATVVWAGGTLVKSLYVNCAQPTSRDDCKNGHWRNFPGFTNQGDCVSFVATKGKNPPADSP
jgi:hypothetical protein